MTLQELTKEIVRELVDKPDGVEVTQTISQGGQTVVLTVCGGHLVYVLTKKGSGTVAFDVTTGGWHERKSYGYPYWRVVALAQYADQVYALSEDGIVGVMDANTYTEFNDVQVVEFVTAPLYAEGRRVFLSEVDLTIKSQ